MPNIRDLFGLTPDVTDANEDDFDLQGFMDEADKLISTTADRTRPHGAVAQDPPTDPSREDGGEPSPAESDPGSEPAPDEGGEPEPAGAPSALPSVPSAPADPVLEMLKGQLADPIKAKRIFDALAEEAPKPVTAKLPEDVDPNSFEAQLWAQQQEIQRTIGSLAESTKAQREAFEKQQASVMADAAGRVFSARYDGKLEPADVMAIAQSAGAKGTPAAYAQLPSYQGNLQGAFDAALEAELWGNPAMRAKVMDEPAPAPVAQTGESITRKRKLGALSSGASPVSGAGTARKPLETRADGRFTGESKELLVKELAGKLSRGTEGI